MTIEQAMIEMRNIIEREDGDTEMNHMDADKVLCDLLLSLGYRELVDAYRSIYKWYA